MSHVDKKLKWCIGKAEKEGEDHRGLKVIKPDIESAKKHIGKANHNLKAMIYLIKGNFPDWAVNASFYAMYHCLLGILGKYGYESRNQECTFTAIEHLIEHKKIGLDINKLRSIAKFDSSNLEGNEIIKLREEFQYSTRTDADSELMKKLLRETKEFIDAAREDIEKKE